MAAHLGLLIYGYRSLEALQTLHEVHPRSLVCKGQLIPGGDVLEEHLPLHSVVLRVDIRDVPQPMIIELLCHLKVFLSLDSLLVEGIPEYLRVLDNLLVDAPLLSSWMLHRGAHHLPRRAIKCGLAPCTCCPVSILRLPHV